MTAYTRQFPFFLTRAYGLTISVSAGLFLFIFMSAFLPFGVSNYDPDHEYTVEFFLSMVGFMLGSSLVAAINELLLKPLIVRTTTLKVVLIWNLWLIVILGLTNFFIYNLFGNWHDLGLGSAMEFVTNCGMVFLFPLTGTFFYFRYRDLQQEYHEVLELNPPSNMRDQMLHLEGQGSSDRISIRVDDFLYARAQDNYIELNFLQEQQPKKILLRMSMTQLIAQSDERVLLRCHRSYSVNRLKVGSVRWGSAPEICLRDQGICIPVSRSYRKEVERAFGGY